jgi:hypothetical protein
MADKAKTGIKSQENSPTVPYVIFRRFILPDLDELGIWLLGRLRKNRPCMNDRSYVSWLRSCMESSEFHFIRSKSAVGMAQRVNGPMDQKILVKENFIYAKPGGEDEAAQIYREFTSWTENIGAHEYVLSFDSDVDKKEVERYMGNIVYRTVGVVKFKS